MASVNCNNKKNCQKLAPVKEAHGTSLYRHKNRQVVRGGKKPQFQICTELEEDISAELSNKLSAEKEKYSKIWIFSTKYLYDANDFRKGEIKSVEVWAVH